MYDEALKAMKRKLPKTLTEKEACAVAEAVGKMLAKRMPAPPSNMVDPGAAWYQAACALAHGASGKTIRYLSSWSDRYAAVTDFLVFADDGRILLTRRSEKVQHPGKWCLPGGHPEDGEQLNVAAARELREETGLVFTPEEIDRATVVKFWTFQGDYHGEKGKRFVQLALALHADLSRRLDLNTDSEEVDDCDFFDLAEVLGPNPPVELAFPGIQDVTMRAALERNLHKTVPAGAA